MTIFALDCSEKCLICVVTTVMGGRVASEALLCCDLDLVCGFLWLAIDLSSSTQGGVKEMCRQGKIKKSEVKVA